MRTRHPISTALRYPLWVAQLFTGAKSFMDNPVIGSRRLNRWGLHRGRVKLATAMALWRRRRLARRYAAFVPAQWREGFDRDGFVAIPDFLPPDDFARLRSAVLDHRAPAREMRQGDAITRRMAINPEMLAAVPELRAFYSRQDVRGLLRYVSSFAVEPLHYIQTILTHCDDDPAQKGSSDPQRMLHADAFQPSMKAWFFLNDVEADQAAFTYVPGSHRLTPERLEWEYRRSITPPEQLDRMSARAACRRGRPCRPWPARAARACGSGQYAGGGGYVRLPCARCLRPTGRPRGAVVIQPPQPFPPLAWRRSAEFAGGRRTQDRLAVVAA